MHTDIHASSGIRTHDASVRAGEGGSCLRPRGHCIFADHSEFAYIYMYQRGMEDILASYSKVTVQILVLGPILTVIFSDFLIVLGPILTVIFSDFLSPSWQLPR
jgi:hypothetical protein